MWRQDQNLASLGCLPPACAGPACLQAPQPSPDPTPCGLRRPLRTQSSQGMRSLGWPWGRSLPGRVQGRLGETEAAGGGLGGPTASPTCHATENHEKLYQPKATLPSSWAQTGTHRGISEPVRAQFTYSSNKDAGGKGRVGLWQSCQWRGGNWGSVGLYGRLFKGSGCFCTPLCLSIGPSSGVPLPWAEEPPLRTAPPSLFVLLEKFPSACESQLGSLTGSIWLERRKTGVRVVRFGEGSRLLATREAGWAAPAHRVGRLQGWALGRPAGPPSL